MGGLGPIRAGMTVEAGAAARGLARHGTQPAGGECWYLRYDGGLRISIS